MSLFQCPEAGRARASAVRPVPLAKSQVSEAFRNLPRFVRVNMVLTGIWTAAFALAAGVCALIVQEDQAAAVPLATVQVPAFVVPFVRDDGEHLVPGRTDESGAREDIVDEVIERALDSGAEVVFVPDGALSDGEGAAAALRY